MRLSELARFSMRHSQLLSQTEERERKQQKALEDMDRRRECKDLAVNMACF